MSAVALLETNIGRSRAGLAQLKCHVARVTSRHIFLSIRGKPVSAIYYGAAEILVSAAAHASIKVLSGQTGALLNQIRLIGEAGIRIATTDATGSQRSDVLFTDLTKSGELRLLDGLSLAEVDAFFALEGSAGGLSIAGS